MTILEIQEICKDFGGLRALNNVTFNVDRGVIKGIVGPNGAGKTTLLNIVSGILQPTAGQIFLKGRI